MTEPEFNDVFRVETDVPILEQPLCKGLQMEFSDCLLQQVRQPAFEFSAEEIFFHQSFDRTPCLSSFAIQKLTQKILVNPGRCKAIQDIPT